MPDPTSIVIGIPTFRRPDLLGTLLESLLPQVDGERAQVVVADNDAGEEAPRVTAEFRARGLPVTCVPVPLRGISQARNEIIREATRICPDWRFVVMLDDDGRVLPGWFDALISGAERHQADVAAGPVLGDLPADAPLMARSSVYAGRPRYLSGPVAMLNGAQNIAISRRICDMIGDPWFDVALGRSGGEDYHFFRRVVSRGGRLVWCDDACVLEPTPADRLHWRALVRRIFRSNAIAAQTDLEFLDRSEIVRDLRRRAAAPVRSVAAGVVRRDPHRLAKAALEAVSLAGRATGLASRRASQTVHGA